VFSFASLHNQNDVAFVLKMISAVTAFAFALYYYM